MPGTVLTFEVEQGSHGVHVHTKKQRNKLLHLRVIGERGLRKNFEGQREKSNCKGPEETNSERQRKLKPYLSYNDFFQFLSNIKLSDENDVIMDDVIH